MPRNQDPNQQANRPADVAAPDSVGGMARRLLNPAHLRDLPTAAPPPCGSRGPSSSGGM